MMVAVAIMVRCWLLQVVAMVVGGEVTMMVLVMVPVTGVTYCCDETIVMVTAQ